MSRLRANQITNENANGSPNFPHGLTVTGIVTASSLNSTATQIVAGAGVTANSGGVDTVGVVTATSFKNKAGGTLTPSPTTTQGDLIVRGASADARLPIGTAGQALKVNGAANGFEFGTAGGIVGFKHLRNTNTTTVNSTSFTTVFSITYTPQDGANNKIYILSAGSSGQDDQNAEIAYIKVSCSGQHTTDIPGSDTPIGVDLSQGQQWHSYSQFLQDPNVTGNGTMTYNFQVKTSGSQSDWRPTTSMSMTVIEVAAGVDQTA